MDSNSLKFGCQAFPLKVKVFKGCIGIEVSLFSISGSSVAIPLNSGSCDQC